jgi:hypothetical protein
MCRRWEDFGTAVIGTSVENIGEYTTELFWISSQVHASISGVTAVERESQRSMNMNHMAWF